MKGIKFVEEGQAALIDEEMPVCTDDTMLLRTLYSGLSNGTERNFLVGGNYGAGRPYPKRIAYQQVSEVIACGTAITRFAVAMSFLSARHTVMLSIDRRRSRIW
jgi:hypothetical protein